MEQNRKRNILCNGIIACVIPILLVACNSSVVYDQHESIPQGVWNKDVPVLFTYDVTDTSKIYSIEIDIENSNEYMYSNLFLFSTIQFPDSLNTRDTLECMLADYKGEWVGKGLWNYTNTFGFKRNIRFPQPGTYTFSIQQAMRCTNKACDITGIESVGLRIIKQ